MALQTLIATMHRDQYDFLSQMNLEGEVIVVNQCDRCGMEQMAGNGFHATVISSTQRGLSNSRNEAIAYADGELFMTGDDDICYRPGYQRVIEQKFAEHPEADIIAFNIERHHLPGNRNRRQQHDAWRAAPKNRYYPSVSIVFRRRAFERAGLRFNPLFGAGARYASGEESLVLKEARRAGLRVFESSEIVADVDFSQSTWFQGYDEKYFYDKGAWLRCAYPHACIVLKYYYLKLRGKTQLDTCAILRALRRGIRSLP